MRRVRAELPKTADTISVELLLVRNEGHVFKHGLRNQHPIKWVLVRTGERSGRLPMRKADRQRDKTLSTENVRKVDRDARGSRQLANADFCGDLPSRGGADEDVVASVLDRGAGRR